MSYLQIELLATEKRVARDLTAQYPVDPVHPVEESPAYT